jgi:hypothetical protein
VDGIWFSSGKEGRRWSELKLMEEQGKITHLERQVNYPIFIDGIKITTCWPVEPGPGCNRGRSWAEEVPFLGGAQERPAEVFAEFLLQRELP